MDYSHRLRSGSVARRRAADRDEINMIEALERGLDLEEAELADDDSAASVEIGQFEQVDASTRSTGGGRRGGESSLPSFAVRQADARILQGGGITRVIKGLAEIGTSGRCFQPLALAEL